MITFEQVTKRYASGVEALSGLSFSIDPGEMVFLTGHSGAGKSTLLKLLMLIERPTFGRICVDGHCLRSLRNRHIPAYRRTLGSIFQAHHLLPESTVYENVALPLLISGYRNKEVQKRVYAALDKVGLLQKLHVLPANLSGGEQQRVGIARAVVHKPKMLIADEPTGNLDPHLSQEIMQLFRQFNQVGVTVIIATHDYSLVDDTDTHCLALHQGRLVQEPSL